MGDSPQKGPPFNVMKYVKLATIVPEIAISAYNIPFTNAHANIASPMN